MSDIDASEENFQKTWDMLSWVQKPKLVEKYVKRPPFRWLHELIISVLNAKSYRQDLFEGPELNGKDMTAKEDKYAFLTKIRDTVAADLGVEIDLNPQKVCTGKEMEKSRTFMQYLALAAHTVKVGAPAAAAEPKAEKPKPAEEAKTEAEPEAEPEAAPAPAPAASEPESKTNAGGSEINVDDSVPKTGEMIKAIIDKPVMKEKLLKRPPFRFVYDVFFNIMKKNNFWLDRFGDVVDKDTKSMSKPERLAVLQKVLDLTKETLGVEIDFVPKNVMTGKECNKTRQFLQYFCIAADRNKTAPAPESAPKKSRPAQEPRRREPEPVESKTDNVELPEAPRTQLRPTTARRAPPKLAQAAQEKDRKKQFVLEDVGTDGLILSGDDESESSDDNDLAEEQTKKKHKKKGKKGKKRTRGKLINKIENELDKDDDASNTAGKEVQEEETKEETGSGIRLRSNIGKSRRALDQTVNVDNLQTQIQKLVQSTNPLAKCMDFVNDDLQAMDSEIEKWRSAYRRHSSKLEEEERKTTEQLAPLQQEISNVDKEVIAVLTKIQECKAKIKQNDGRTTEMLRFVVNQKS